MKTKPKWIATVHYDNRNLPKETRDVTTMMKCAIEEWGDIECAMQAVEIALANHRPRCVVEVEEVTQ